MTIQEAFLASAPYVGFFDGGCRFVGPGTCKWCKEYIKDDVIEHEGLCYYGDHNYNEPG